MTMLKKIVSRITGSSFVRSVATLTGGSAVAMALPILAAPVLGRLYMPAHYGALAQYMAVAAVLSVLATLQFQHAIIAERSYRSAVQAVWLCIAASFGSGVLTGIAIALAWGPFLSQTAAGLWFALLPLSVMSAGLVAGGSFLANRQKKYRLIATVQVIHVTLTLALSIALGLLAWGSDGLFTAYFTGQVVQVCAYLFLLFQPTTVFQRPSIGRLRILVRRNWRFPIFTLPSEFSGQLNLQVPIFALTVMGADATLGAFSRARQLVSMPLTVAGSAVAQVFRQDAAKLYRETGDCRPIMLRTAGGLLALGFLPCIAFMALGPMLFSLYLGPSWHEAGVLAQILAPMLLLRLVVSPLTSAFFFTGNQLLDLQLMLLSTVILCTTVGSAWYILGSPISIVIGFSVGYSFVYAIYFATCFRVGRK
jgi:O-antigen/teichoic acid export membrane protein